MGRRTAVGVLACALLLAGCAEKHEASTALPSATTATPSSSSAAALPAVGPADFPVPIEARQRTPAGVQAFTRYYLGLINRSADASNAEALRDLSEACETCERIAGDTAKDAAAGYRYQGGQISIVSAAPATVRGNASEFAFLADQAELVVVDQSGKPVPGLSFKPLHKVSSGSTARWDAERRIWLMTQLTFG